jgi:hypothetical protein
LICGVVDRHHDHRPAADLGCGQRDALRMITGGRTDHAALELLCREVDDLVVGAAQLEGKNRLQIFALEQQVRLPIRAERPGAKSSGVSIATS